MNYPKSERGGSTKSRRVIQISDRKGCFEGALQKSMNRISGYFGKFERVREDWVRLRVIETNRSFSAVWKRQQDSKA